MDDAAWEKLFAMAGSEAIAYAKDTVIMRDSEAHEFMYRVTRGSVRVEKGDPRSSASRTAVVNHLPAGATFGEMSFLDGAPACATCLADSENVEVSRLSRVSLESLLASDAALARDFYRQTAIEITRRLQRVSAASADMRDAPRGLTSPMPPLVNLSAKKLLKVRHRLNIPDTETMALMAPATMINPARRRLHGTLYVFETTVGFVHKMFGFKQHEAVPYRHVSEVLRETLTLRKEDRGIELTLTSGKAYTFFPSSGVDDVFDAMHKCREAFETRNHRLVSVSAAAFEQDPHQSDGSECSLRDRSRMATPRSARSELRPASAALPTERKSRRESSRREDQAAAAAARDALARDAAALGGGVGAVALARLLAAATLERYKAGDVIIDKGSRPATLFNIARGRVSVEVRRVDDETDLTHAVKILTLYEPAMFGEMSFLTGEPACASVVADLDTEVWQMSASHIDSSFGSSSVPAAEQALFYRHLGGYLSARVRQLTAMVGENFAATAGSLALEEVLSNAVFFALFTRWLSQSNLVDAQLLHFLTDMRDFLATPANESRLIAARHIYTKYLGANAVSPTSVRARTGNADDLHTKHHAPPHANTDAHSHAQPHAAGGAPPPRKVAILVSEAARDEIASLLTSETIPPMDLFAPAVKDVLDTLQAHAYRHFAQSSAFQALLDLKAKEAHVPTLDNFKLLQILGEGYEGKVLQARKKDCGVMYALKVLDKTVLASRSRRWQLHATRELECLRACDHPYIVSIAYAFQTPQYLYMVQEHVPNHTLARYLEAHEGKPIREPEVRFMAAELVLALAHMHARSIVYRDLKPANVLVDSEGHLRMVDMGMASRLDPETGKRKSVCGTQRYMAPEMKAKQPYDESVDWYSLGKLILDCHGRDPYSRDCAYWETSGLLELIDALLVKDPTRRRGYGVDGVRTIQRSAFFASVDWPALDAKRAPSPLQPALYLREADVTLSRQFRNGEDIHKLVEKLQSISLDNSRPADGPGGEVGPGMIPDWDHISPSVVYREYLASPFHNAKSHV